MSLERALTVLQTLLNRNRGSDKHHLLGLPAEVRNRIYRFSIIKSDEWIQLSATSPLLPGLLSTCKQIREETINLYFTENKFEIELLDYNAEAVVPAHQLHGKYYAPSPTTKQDISSLPPFKFLGVPNWQNFVGWCRVVHQQRMPGLGVQSDNTDETEIAIAAIHDVVINMSVRPWEEVENVLEGFRKMMVMRDPAWAT